MRSYRRHAIFVSAFLAGYVLLGGVLRFARPLGEIFPVSSWTLFLHVPNEVVEYGVEILAVDGDTLDAPLAFHEARKLFPGAGDVRADRVVHRMGVALGAGDEVRLAELRRLFERHWLGPEHAPVRYRLVRRRYVPLERWKTGAVGETATLRGFSFEGESS